MLYEEILASAGFRTMGSDCAVRSFGELNIIAEQSSSGFMMTVPCASPLVDHEKEISDFLCKQAKKNGDLKAAFTGRKIVIQSDCVTEDNTENVLYEMNSMIRDAQEQFDLLPVCMCCGRVGTVSAEKHDGKLRTICGVCADEERLKLRQTEVRREMAAQTQNEMREYIRQEKPIRQLLKIGIKGSIAGCALGTIFMFIGFFLPMFHYMVFFPGVVIGVYIADRIRKVGFVHGALRYMIANISAIVSTVVISSVTAFLNGLFMLHVGFESAVPLEALFGSMLIMNTFLGLPGLFLSQIIVGFCSAE